MPSPDLSKLTWPKSVLNVIIVDVIIIQLTILLQDEEADKASEEYKASQNEDGHQDAENLNNYHGYKCLVVA